jgi:hypothetical protein
MPRTTVDIDAPVLKDLKRLQRREQKSLGRLISDLVMQALAIRRAGEGTPAARFEWTSREMQARLDIADKDALHRALDEPT